MAFILISELLCFSTNVAFLIKLKLVIRIIQQRSPRIQLQKLSLILLGPVWLAQA